jgi:hypothetical protein
MPPYYAGRENRQPFTDYRHRISEMGSSTVGGNCRRSLFFVDFQKVSEPQLDRHFAPNCKSSSPSKYHGPEMR